MKKNKILILSAVILIAIIIYASGAVSILSLETLANKKTEIDFYAKSEFVKSSLFFIFIYILVSVLAIPGAGALSLLAGNVFGLYWGILFVSIGSNLGALFSFVTARYFFRDWIHCKWPTMLLKVEKGFQKDMKSYLFFLRLVPLAPFFLVNVLVAQTSISLFNFLWVSLLGMLPGTFLFVKAGEALSEINTPVEIFTPKVLIWFILIGFLPFVSKRILKRD